MPTLSVFGKGGLIAAFCAFCATPAISEELTVDPKLFETDAFEQLVEDSKLPVPEELSFEAVKSMPLCSDEDSQTYCKKVSNSRVDYPDQKITMACTGYSNSKLTGMCYFYMDESLPTPLASSVLNTIKLPPVAKFYDKEGYVRLISRPFLESLVMKTPVPKPKRIYATMIDRAEQHKINAVFDYHMDKDLRFIGTGYLDVKDKHQYILLDWLNHDPKAVDTNLKLLSFDYNGTKRLMLNLEHNVLNGMQHTYYRDGRDEWAVEFQNNRLVGGTKDGKPLNSLQMHAFQIRLVQEIFGLIENLDLLFDIETFQGDFI